MNQIEGAPADDHDHAAPAPEGERPEGEQPEEGQTESEAPVAIHTRGLAKRYGSFQALQSLDLDIHEGDIFGFIGPNGAGKTTTIRILSTLLPPTSRHVLGWRAGT